MSVAGKAQPLRNTAAVQRDKASSCIAEIADGIDAITIAFRNHLILWGYSYGLVIADGYAFAFSAKEPAMNLNWYLEHAPQSVVGVYTPRARMELVREDLEAHFETEKFRGR